MKSIAALALIGAVDACSIRVYEHDNYKGGYASFGGTRSVRRIDHAGWYNDRMSSFQLWGGACVTFYEHDHFRGNQYSTCNSMRRIPRWFNDKMTGFRLTCRRLSEEEEIVEDIIQDEELE